MCDKQPRDIFKKQFINPNVNDMEWLNSTVGVGDEIKKYKHPIVLIFLVCSTNISYLSNARKRLYQELASFRQSLLLEKRIA